MIACRAPSIASYERSISSGRACVSTAIVVSSGIRSSSISRRTKSKSVFDADGNPTSISLNPSCTSRSNMRCLRSESIGLTSAWLPSRRSVEHQIGACWITWLGQVRSGRSTVGYGRYFQCGIDMAWGSSKGTDGLLPTVRERGNGYVAWPSPLGENEEKRGKGEALLGHRFRKHSEKTP